MRGRSCECTQYFRDESGEISEAVALVDGGDGDLISTTLDGVARDRVGEAAIGSGTKRWRPGGRADDGEQLWKEGGEEGGVNRMVRWEEDARMRSEGGAGERCERARMRRDLGDVRCNSSDDFRPLDI